MQQIIKTLDNVEETEIGPLDNVAAKVWLFNHIAGNYAVKPTMKALEQQIEIIQEELNETLVAILADDPTELVDGTGDLLVTVLGLAYQVELLGHNLMEATDAICDQNLSKYPLEEKLANDTISHYAEEGTHLTKAYNEEYDVWVLKDTANKIRKPLGFGKIDLSEFLAK